MRITAAVLLSTALLCAAGTRGTCGGKVNEFRLSNGMRGIFVRDTKNPLLSLQLFFPGGGINENEAQAGLASFTHALLMKGTKTRNADKLADEIDSIGASMSSDIEYDYATLGFSALDSYFGRGCELLSDIAFNPSFDAKEIEKERATQLAGIRSRQDSIFDTVNDAFLKLFYGSHPYAWPESGRLETVSKFSKADLEKWHSAHYTPDGMFMVIVGSATFESARETAEKYFGGVKAGPRAGSVPPEAAAPKPRSETLRSAKFQQAYLMVGFPAPSITGRDYAALKVTNAMLGSRMSGRLFTELREKLGLGYEVNSFYPTRRQLSRFVVYLGLEKKNVELAKTKIREILDDLKKNPVSDKELRETKNYIKGVYLMDHQTVNRRAWYLGWWELMGAGWAYDGKYVSDLENVNAEDVMRAARACFNDVYVQVELLPEGDNKKK